MSRLATTRAISLARAAAAAAAAALPAGCRADDASLAPRPLAQCTLDALRDAHDTALVLARQRGRPPRTNAGPQGPGNSGARIACGVLGAERATAPAAPHRAARRGDVVVGAVREALPPVGLVAAADG